MAKSAIKEIKDIDGKVLTLNHKLIRDEANSSILFWKKMLYRKGWKIEAKKNLAYWRHLLKQVK